MTNTIHTNTPIRSSRDLMSTSEIQSFLHNKDNHRTLIVSLGKNSIITTRTLPETRPDIPGLILDLPKDNKGTGIAALSLADDLNPIGKDIDWAQKLSSSIRSIGESFVDRILIKGKKYFSYAEEAVHNLPKQK